MRPNPILYIYFNNTTREYGARCEIGSESFIQSYKKIPEILYEERFDKTYNAFVYEPDISYYIAAIDLIYQDLEIITDKEAIDRDFSSKETAKDIRKLNENEFSLLNKMVNDYKEDIIKRNKQKNSSG